MFDFIAANPYFFTPQDLLGLKQQGDITDQQYNELTSQNN